MLFMCLLLTLSICLSTSHCIKNEVSHKGFLQTAVELFSGRTNCTTAKIKIVSMKYEEKNYQQKNGKKKYTI